MKKEFFASVVLLAIFIVCTAWYRGVPSSASPVKKEQTQQPRNACVK